MKKLFVMMLVVVMSIVMLAGCGNNTEDAGTSDVVSEESSESSDVEETDTTDESVNTSEKSSATEEETVVYSADEVMAHIDTLITQFPYNNPEHIKTLVIAANMDYIAEEDLNTLLSTYGYSIDELAVLYDECILDNAAALNESFKYSQGQVDTLADEDTYEYRITIEAAILNKTDAENAKWYDEMLIARSKGKDDVNDIMEFRESVMSVTDNNLSMFERVCYSYAWGILYNELSYVDYLDNPFVVYNK